MATTVVITGDKILQLKINQVRAKLIAPKLMLTRIGKDLVKYFKENMDSEGKKLTKERWKALKPEVAAAKARLGFGSKKILERTGKLKSGIKTISVTRNSVTVGNKVPYYKYHQLGGKKIPQRKQLGVNDDVSKIVMNEIKKTISFV